MWYNGMRKSMKWQKGRNRAQAEPSKEEMAKSQNRNLEESSEKQNRLLHFWFKRLIISKNGGYFMTRQIGGSSRSNHSAKELFFQFTNRTTFSRFIFSSPHAHIKGRDTAGKNGQFNQQWQSEVSNIRIPGEEQGQIGTSRDTDVATTKISGANGSRRALAESECVHRFTHGP